MSWSVSAIGKPEDVAAYLEEESGRQTGQSKVEYDDALPHLVGLVRQTFASAEPIDGHQYVCPLIKIEANGSGYIQSGIQAYRNCQVKIETFHSRLVSGVAK